MEPKGSPEAKTDGIAREPARTARAAGAGGLPLRGFAGNSNDLASAYQLMGPRKRCTPASRITGWRVRNHTLKSVRAHWFGLSDNGLHLATRERQLAALRRL